MIPEVPDNLSDPMPPVTYCKCAQTWVQMDDTAPAKNGYVQVSLRMKCPVCGYWTDAVPLGEK